MVRAIPKDKIIELNQVGKVYGGRWIFRNVSIQLARGECLAIFGGNGTGKSTIVRAAIGFGTFDEGEVTVLGNAIDAQTDWTLIRKEIGFVSQGLNLWPYRTVLANVAEGLLYGKGLKEKEAFAEAEYWLNKLNVHSHALKFPAQLSGGEQQRVAIARAMALRPQALILDEPTSGLDPITSGEIAELLLSLRAEGFALVIISHQIDFLRRIADYGYFLDGGSIREEGVVADMLSNPRTEQLSTFIARIRRGW